MSFRAVFIAITIATALIVSAYLVNSRRPRMVVEQPSAAFVRASGKCAECHLNTQYSVVHEFEMSAHAKKGSQLPGLPSGGHGSEGDGSQRVCHQHRRHARPIAARVTRPSTSSSCTAATRRLPGRRWPATRISRPSRLPLASSTSPGRVKRPPNPLATLEGAAATKSGCASCHSVGRPNADGTIGNCTACHTRHTSSVEFARLPTTCGQCHLGPDHSQMEIYTESKHGVMFAAQRDLLNLSAPPVEADHARHVRAHLRDLSHERAQRTGSSLTILPSACRTICSPKSPSRGRTRRARRPR